MQTPEYFFKEGCFISELHNTETDPAVSVARARVLPGETTRWHKLTGITERYLVVTGQGLVERGGQAPLEIQAGESVLIAAEQAQRITNTGSEDLIFLAVCTPRFCPEAYTDLEDQP